MIERALFRTATREDISSLFPPLQRRINKGDMGRVLCICGSYDPCGAAMCGAAFFSAMAAYRCGAGIVELFTHRKNYEALASLVPEAVFSLYDTEEEDCTAITSRLLLQIKKADSIVLGCGLGTSTLAHSLVKTVLEVAKCPLIIDADGLNIISESDGLRELLKKRQAPTVLTPHPGEMRRLTGKPVDEILNDTAGIARSLSLELGATVLLKDHRTVITDGDTVYLNQSGNAGMASAGMGDVLSGIIGALLARAARQKRTDGTLSVSYLAATAAYIHGLAGDAAAAEIGEYSLTASDVIRAIPRVIRA